jgi:hypothetical protein
VTTPTFTSAMADEIFGLIPGFLLIASYIDTQKRNPKPLPVAYPLPDGLSDAEFERRK